MPPWLSLIEHIVSYDHDQYAVSIMLPTLLNSS